MTDPSDVAARHRREKVQQIFDKFDKNKDGHLNKEEMAALVTAVNPNVRFSDEQIAAILDEVFRTYGEFIHNEGLTLDGLRRTYDDGAGDVDRDFDALGLRLREELEGDKGPNFQPRKINPADITPLPNPGAPAQAALSEFTKKLMVDLEAILNQQPISAQALADLRARADKDAKNQEEAFEAHMAMGHMLTQSSRHEDALLSYQRAITLQPDDARAHFRLGNCLYNLYRYKEAQQAYEKARTSVKIPADTALLPKIHVNLGIALEAEGLLMNASEHYREACILDQSHFRALKLMGSALFGLGELRASEEALEHALSLQPNYVDAHSDLGCCLREMGNKQDAYKSFTKAVELDPNHLAAQYNLGNLKRELGDFAGAIQCYNLVVQKNPNDWRALLNKASCHIALGQGQQAEALIEKAKALTGDRIELYDYMKQIKRLDKNEKRGNLNLTKMLKPLDPNVNTEQASFLAQSTGLKFTRDKGYIARSDKGLYGKLKIKLKEKKIKKRLDVELLQRLTPISSCPLRMVRKEATDAHVPADAKDKMVRKSVVETILRRMLEKTDPLVFAQIMKSVNSRILPALQSGSQVRGQVDLGMFLAVTAALCDGTPVERKDTAFEVLKWRAGVPGSGPIPTGAAKQYFAVLQEVFRGRREGEPVAAVGMGGTVEGASGSVDVKDVKVKVDKDTSGSDDEREVAALASGPTLTQKAFAELADSKLGYKHFDGLPLMTHRHGFNIMERRNDEGSFPNSLHCGWC